MLPKRALQLQGQLENIGQAANTYFDVGDPSLADEKRRAEIDQDLASFVNRMFEVIEPSSRFDESDERILRNELSRAQVALRFRRLRRWNTFVEHDEGTVLAVVPAGQAEDPISAPDARQEFNESLVIITGILTRIPDQTHGEIEKASVVDTKSEDWKRKLESKASFTIVEAADIASETERSLRNKTDKRGRPGPLKLNSQGRIIADSLKAYLLDER